jgi:hypothetical protein
VLHDFYMKKEVEKENEEKMAQHLADPDAAPLALKEVDIGQSILTFWPCSNRNLR